MAKIIDLKLNMKDGVTSTLNKVRKSTDETCKGFDVLKGRLGMLKTAFGGLMAGLAVNQIIDWGKDLHNAWEVQRKAEQAVNDSIYSNMTARGASQQAIDNEVKAYKDLASELQGVGVIGDEVTLSGMAMMTQMGMTTDKVKELTPLVQDLAVKQNGVNVSQEQFAETAKDVANMVNMGKLSLQKYGIQVSDTEKKEFKKLSTTERYNFVLKKLKDNVEGVNKKLAETPEGKIARVNNEIGDIKEQLGQQIDLAIEPMLTPLLSFVKWLNGDFPKFIDGAKQVVKDFVDDNAVFFDTLKDIGKVWIDAFEGFASHWGDIWKGLKDVCNGALTFIGSILKGDILGALNGLKTLARGVCETVGNAFQGLADTVISAFASMIGKSEEWREEQARLKEQAQFAENPQNLQITKGVGVSNPSGGTIKHNALGTSYFSGGLTHINERNEGEIVNLPSGTQIIPHDVATKHNALGTSYFSGGPTHINERNEGEIVNLPSGTQIIPHDVATKQSNNSNVFNINVNVQGNVIGNEEYTNELGNALFNKLQFAINNM